MISLLRWVLATALILPLQALAGPPPLEAYGRLPALDGVVLSPSGERFAFDATIDGVRRVLARSVDGELLLVAPLEDIKLRGISWAGENFVVLRVSQMIDLGWYYGERHELVQHLALDLRDGSARSLLAHPHFLNASFGDYGFVERDGEWYGLFSVIPMERSSMMRETWLSPQERHLVEVNLGSGELKTLARGPGTNAGWVLDREGKVLANARYDDRRGFWWLYPGNRQRRPLVEVADALGSHRLLGQGWRSGTVLYRMAEGDEIRRLMEIPVDGEGAAVPVFPGESIRRLLFDDATGRLAGFERESDEREWIMIDPVRQARVDAARRAFPGLNVRVRSVNHDFDRLVVTTDGRAADAEEGDAGTWWLVDVGSGQANVLGEARPAVPPEWVGPVRMLEFEAQDGLRVPAVLTLPPHREPKALPVVVLPHGRPEMRDYPEFHWMAQAFASRGYAVLQPNVRGSAGYGMAFRNAGFGEWGGKMQTDVSDGVAALARQGIVDADRACILGSSYGGYVALAGVTLQQGLYRCAVSIAGISDLTRFLDDVGERRWAHALRYFQSFLGEERRLFNRALNARSPARLARQADAPVLLIHGKDDVIIPMEQSRVMATALRRAGKPVQMVELDSEDHYLSRESTRLQALEAAVAFVQRHLPAFGAGTDD